MDRTKDVPEVTKLPQAAIDAWANWEPVKDPVPPFTFRQSQIVREAFMDGFLATRPLTAEIADLRAQLDEAKTSASDAWEKNIALETEIAALREELTKERGAHWFYLGDDCSSDNCRFGIDECISEDFEWHNEPEGNHVLQISGARPVPDMWVALHYFTEAEKDARDSDDEYTYTVHATEDGARQALAKPEVSK